MHARLVSLAAAASLLLASAALAKPPARAPAHGYRAKQVEPSRSVEAKPASDSKSLEVVYDSERGIHVAIGLPNVFFHAGHYYREQEGHWQVSLTGDGDWSLSASSDVPEEVAKHEKSRGAAKRHPGKAKHRK